MARTGATASPPILLSRYRAMRKFFLIRASGAVVRKISASAHHWFTDIWVWFMPRVLIRIKKFAQLSAKRILLKNVSRNFGFVQKLAFLLGSITNIFNSLFITMLSWAKRCRLFYCKFLFFFFPPFFHCAQTGKMLSSVFSIALCMLPVGAK